MSKNNLNIVIVEGNLTKDPEIKDTNKSTVAKFSIACNHLGGDDSKDKDPVSYVDVEAWGIIAENTEKYLKKGKSVTIQGHLRQERWEDKDGNKHQRVKVVASNIRYN